MRPILLLTFCLVLSACTRVAFTVPVGQPAPPKDIAMLAGEWTGEKAVVWHVEPEAGSAYFRASGTEDGKPKDYRFVVTTVGHDVFLLGVEDKELNAFLPLRIAGADDALALLYPDTEEIERLVKEQKLTAVFNKEKKAWIFPPGEWESLLAGKQFWALNLCLPFLKKKAAVPPAEIAPTAVTPAPTPPAHQP